MLKSFGSKKTVARLITLVLLGQFILGLGSAASLTAQETSVESVVIAGLGSSQLKEVLKGMLEPDASKRWFRVQDKKKIFEDLTGRELV